MSVMKDITNYNNIIEGSRNARASDNIFVSFSTPRPDGSEQTTPQSTRPLIRLLTEIPSNDIDLSSSSFFDQEFGVLPSVLLTPTSPNDVNNLKFSTECCSSARPRKKLRLEIDETQERIPLQNKLQSLTKPQLIELVNTLVSERHPELEEVRFEFALNQFSAVLRHYTSSFVRILLSLLMFSLRLELLSNDDQQLICSQEFYQLVPEPNLREMEVKIKTLKRNIYKSFPPRGSHVGSARDVYTYRRVSTQIQAFKVTTFYNFLELNVLFPFNSSNLGIF